VDQGRQTLLQQEIGAACEDLKKKVPRTSAQSRDGGPTAQTRTESKAKRSRQKKRVGNQGRLSDQQDFLPLRIKLNNETNVSGGKRRYERHKGERVPREDRGLK